MPDGTCKVDDCDEPAARRGWCSRHYQRWKRHRDPLAGGHGPRELPDLPGERWLPIEGYEGFYDVSDLGRVRSLPRLGRQGCVRRLSLPPKQTHYRIRLYRDGVGETRLVHRLVAAAFIGPCPDGLEVLHDDGDYLNCAASNLGYGTHSENMFEKRDHGTDHEANKTHCPQRHEYTPENTYSPPSRPNARYCRACHLTETSAAKRRKRAEAA